MKTPERFDRALKALVQAFFNDHLVNSMCSACAVGNIVAAGKGDRLIKIPYTYGCYFDFKTSSGYNNRAWFSTYGGIKQKDRAYSEECLDNIRCTGYSANELIMIEEVFMKNTILDHTIDYPQAEIMQDQFNGLMAVVNVLCEIEGLDAQEYKKAFEYNEEFAPVHAD